MSLHAEWTLHDGVTAISPAVVAKILFDFDANAKYWSFFIPAGADLRRHVGALLSLPSTRACTISSEGDGVLIQMGFADYTERTTSATLIFTGRIFLYIDADLSVAERQLLTLTGIAAGFHCVVRDREYALKRSQMEKPLAFISHDTRDKEDLVRELAREMTRLMCPVWYDEFSLKVGDSLRASIEGGLKEARKCIVVLSPNFLSNNGWSKAEFDSIYTREILEKSNVMLPVWHRVTASEVYDYSPRLADKVGLDSALGVTELGKRLAAAVRT